MNTKTILITGSTDGIGKQCAIDLAKLGHEVIVHGRNNELGISLIKEISKISLNNKVKYINADLTNFIEIKNLADQINSKFNKLDVLLNNAGVIEYKKKILPNGLETTFMVNHMAYFSLSNLLLPILKNTNNSRIINVSSMAQSGSIDFDNLNGEKYFDTYNAYAVSKLANVLMTYKMHRMTKDNGPSVNCLHPGVISTKLLYKGWGIGGASLDSGSSTTVYLASDPKLDKVSGKYYVNSEQRRSVAISYDTRIQDRLWEISKSIMQDQLGIMQ